MQRAVSVVCPALSLMWRSQQKEYIMFYNTVVLSGFDKYGFSTPVPNDHSGLTLGAFLRESNTVGKWYPDCAVKIVESANTEQDNPALTYHHEFHFDRNGSMSHKQAFTD